MSGLDKLLGWLRHEVIKNVSWQFFEKFLNLALTFLVSIYVIRSLGPENYGVLSYSISYVLLFSALTTCGLQTIVVKELISKKIDANLIMGSSIVIMFLGSTLAFILAMSGSIVSHDQSQVVLVVAFGCGANMITSVSVINFYFQAELKSRYTSYVLLFQDVFDAIAKCILVYFKCGVIAIGSLVFIESIMVYMTLYVFYSKISNVVLWKYQWTVIKYLFKESFPLAISGAVINLYMRLDQVMIEHYNGLGAVGEYSVGIKLVEVLSVIPGILSINLFPVMVKKFNDSKDDFDKLMRNLYKGFFYISLGMTIGLSLIAIPLVRILYGDKYKLSGLVFHYGVFSLSLMCIGIINHLWLQINGLQRYAVYITLSGLLCCFGLNLLLIPRYGILGAVFAMLVTQGVASVLAFLFFDKTRGSFKLFLSGITFYR